MKIKGQFTVVSLERYIKLYHGGNKSEYGRSIGRSPQAINNWIKEGRVIGGGVIFAPKVSVNEIDS